MLTSFKAACFTIGLTVVSAVLVVSLREFVLGPATFPAHGSCWRWDWHLLSIHLTGDLLVWSAYTAIPAAVIYLTRSRLLFPSIPLWGAAFVWCCSMTHLFDVVEIWYPIQWSRGIAKLLTGVVSWIFLIVLVKNRRSIVEFSRALVREESAAETSERLAIEAGR